MHFLYRKRKLIFIVVISLAYNSLSVLFAFFLMNVTNSIIASDMNGFFCQSGLATICLTMQILLYVLQTKCVNLYVAHCMTTLKKSLLEGISRFSYQYFANSPIEEYQSFFLNDLKLFENQYYRQILELLTKVSLLFVAILGVCIIDAVFLIVVLLIIAISALIPALFKNCVAKANQQYNSAVKTYLSSLNEFLNGFGVIKNYNVSEQIMSRVFLKNQHAEFSYANLGTKISIANAFMAFIGQILVLVSFALGGYFTVTGRLSTGAIVALSQLITYIIEPVSVLAGTATSLNSVSPIKDNCFRILNYQESQIPPKLKSHPRKIELMAVGFSYDGLNELIKDISITFEFPYKYAIIGRNGSGKSTLLEIIAGMKTGYSGHILLDGHDIKDISEKEYNQYIAYLSQNAFVFSMPIDDNINMFQNRQDFDAQRKYLKSKFRLKAYDNNEVSAETLSGGEKAKVATIRTLIKDSPIILMDEPTAAMDEQSQKAFNDTISSIKGKICIVVTHRLDWANLQGYDRYVIINKNKVYMTSDCQEAILWATKERGAHD